jgi:hypothetical protein
MKPYNLRFSDLKAKSVHSDIDENREKSWRERGDKAKPGKRGLSIFID